MSDQNETTVVETPAEISNEATLKKAVRVFTKYPSAANYRNVIKAMLVVQSAYVAQFHIGEK